MDIRKLREDWLEFTESKAAVAVHNLHKKGTFYRNEDGDTFYYAKNGEKEAEKIGNKEQLIKYLDDLYDKKTDPRLILWKVSERFLGSDAPTHIYFKKKEDAEKYVAEKDYTSGPVSERFFDHELWRLDIR